MYYYLDWGDGSSWSLKKIYSTFFKNSSLFLAKLFKAVLMGTGPSWTVIATYGPTLFPRSSFALGPIPFECARGRGPAPDIVHRTLSGAHTLLEVAVETKEAGPDLSAHSTTQR